VIFVFSYLDVRFHPLLRTTSRIASLSIFHKIIFCNCPALVLVFHDEEFAKWTLLRAVSDLRAEEFLVKRLKKTVQARRFSTAA